MYKHTEYKYILLQLLCYTIMDDITNNECIQLEMREMRKCTTMNERTHTMIVVNK